MGTSEPDISRQLSFRVAARARRPVRTGRTRKAPWHVPPQQGDSESGADDKGQLRSKQAFGRASRGRQSKRALG